MVTSCSAVWAGGVTRFRTTFEATFTSTLWLVSRVSVVPFYIFCFPNLNILQIKSHQSSDHIPLTPTLRGGGNCLTVVTCSFLIPFILCFIYPEQWEKALLLKPARARPGGMEGKMLLFHVPFSLREQKHTFPTYTAALTENQVTHEHVKIDLPLKAGEETWMATSYTHAC